MRCSGARSQVSDYLDGALAAAPAQVLKAHLAACSTCPPLCAALVATREAVARDPAARDPDPVIAEGLVARIVALLGNR